MGSYIRRKYINSWIFDDGVGEALTQGSNGAIVLDGHHRPCPFRRNVSYYTQYYSNAAPLGFSILEHQWAPFSGSSRWDPLSDPDLALLELFFGLCFFPSVALNIRGRFFDGMSKILRSLNYFSDLVFLWSERRDLTMHKLHKLCANFLCKLTIPPHNGLGWCPLPQLCSWMMVKGSAYNFSDLGTQITQIIHKFLLRIVFPDSARGVETPL